MTSTSPRKLVRALVVGSLLAVTTAGVLTAGAETTQAATAVRVEAEAFVSQAGVQREATTDTGGGSNIGWLAAGDWATYAAADLTGLNSVRMRLSSGASTTGVVEVRADGATGTVLASIPVSNTGGWNSWRTVSKEFAKTVSGRHTLALTFRSSSTADFVNVNWLSLEVGAAAPANPAPAPSTPTPTPTSSASATGFPAAQNVGWQPTGVTLKAYTGPTTITTSGTVIDAADIRSSLVIRANNVTIKRSRIMGTSHYVVQQAAGFTGLTLSNVEVTSLSGAVGDRAIASQGTAMTVDRSYVHGTQRGIALGTGSTVTNSYVDGFNNSSGNHATAAMALGGVRNVTLRNNTLGCGTNLCSSALSVYPESAPNDNWTIDHNLFNGGGYCLYLGYTPSAGERPNTNMRVTNNSFGTKYGTNCGSYGPVGSWSWSSGNTWTNNVWYAPGNTKNGKVVTPPS